MKIICWQERGVKKRFRNYVSQTLVQKLPRFRSYGSESLVQRGKAGEILIKGMLNVGNLHISNGAMESFSCQEGGGKF